MADPVPVLIPRDVGSPFNPADPMELAEFEGFCSDVPNDDGMIAALNPPLGEPIPVNANSVRAARILREGFLTGAVALATPDLVTPAVGEPPITQYARQGMSVQDVAVPGLVPTVDVWSFDSLVNNGVDVPSAQREGWPAATIRVREGRVVHTTTGTRSGPHTIHHHGIEPTAMNDGVGHLTFEIGGEYTYQWQAAEAGTYFYHCHRNTVLHFEMGMYGMLIIDPDVPGAPFADGGAGQCYVGNTLTSYAAEAIWVADDFDIRWHGIDRNDGLDPITDHDAGIQPPELDPITGRPVFVSINDPANPHLHDFRPDVFLVTGRPAPFGQDNAVIATAPGTAITPRITRGQKLLIRTLNGSYCTTRWKLPAELPGQVIAADARTFGREPFGRYSAPFTLASINHQFEFTTARRWDILLDIPLGIPAGNYFAEIEFYHWVTNERIRTVRTQIVVD